MLAEDMTALDPSVIPRAWMDATFARYTGRKLKFGYFFDDGVTISSPPVKRAIMQTVEALKAQGHEVELTMPPKVIEAVRIFVAMTSHNGYSSSKY
jgi:Asp-tRNA(Asn)/Glu-tRNA(Gln) amidotransferase A subunit family amidase